MKQALLTMGCALVVAVGSSACSEPDRATTATPPATADRATGTAGGGGMITVADIAGNPTKYTGQTVTVQADVEEVLGPRAFTLDEDAATAGGVDNDLLVISRKAGSLSDIDDQWLNNRVRVTGTVGKWTLVELEREIGWDLGRELEVEVERAKAVLIATSLERVQK